MKTAFNIAVGAALVLSVAGVLIAQTDAFLGVWNLNATESKFVPDPASKSKTRVMVTSHNGMRVSVNRVAADGTTEDFEYTSNLDGKTYPITGQRPYGADSVAGNLTNPTTIQSTWTKGGKTVATPATAVSSDGKVLTITTKGKEQQRQVIQEYRGV